MRGIHRSPANSPHKGQWRGALMFSLICSRMNDWVNNREAGDLRRRRAHYDVTVMSRAIDNYFCNDFIPGSHVAKHPTTAQLSCNVKNIVPIPYLKLDEWKMKCQIEITIENLFVEWRLLLICSLYHTAISPQRIHVNMWQELCFICHNDVMTWKRLPRHRALWEGSPPVTRGFLSQGVGTGVSLYKRSLIFSVI